MERVSESDLHATSDVKMETTLHLTYITGGA